MSAYEILSYEIIDTTQKGVNGPRFVQSIEDLSILMDPNSILMTDNARIHHINDVAATMDDLDLYYAIYYHSKNLFYNKNYKVLLIQLIAFVCFCKKSIGSKSSLYDSIRDALGKVTERHLQSWILHSAKN